jgi:hypothetical protein
MLPPKAGIKMLLLVCTFEKSPLYTIIEGKWKTGARDLSADVRSALIAGPVFAFRKPEGVLVG